LITVLTKLFEENPSIQNAIVVYQTNNLPVIRHGKGNHKSSENFLNNVLKSTPLDSVVAKVSILIYIFVLILTTDKRKRIDTVVKRTDFGCL